MKKYKKSITTALISLIAVLVIGFLIPLFLMGDPIAYIGSSEDGIMSQQQYDFYYNALGLGKPLLEQFADYLGCIFDGSLGYSYFRNFSVAEIVFDALPRTLLVTVPALLLSSFMGLVWGMKAGQKSGKAFDRVSSAFNVLLNAIPLFVITLIAVIVLCFKNKVFPYIGLSSGGLSGIDFVIDRIYHLILPCLCLFLAELPARYLAMRNATAHIMSEKYIFYAKARGLSEKTIRWKYIFPNIREQFVSNLFLSFGTSIGGALVIENIFSINGMGTLVSSAAHSLDYPLLRGVFFVTSFIMIISILVGDIICISTDPLRKRGDANE